jgi:hypothetical protein
MPLVQPVHIRRNQKRKEKNISKAMLMPIADNIHLPLIAPIGREITKSTNDPIAK